jgi:RHS repeat-associated protein
MAFELRATSCELREARGWGISRSAGVGEGSSQLPINEDQSISLYDDPATPESELEITQEAHYYPFGMGHLGPWYESVSPENRYLYNGKELNDEEGVGLYDYGARWYDAALGRWGQVDPLVEEYPEWSPYNYVLGNPIRIIDPDGMKVEIVGSDEYKRRVFDALINLALNSSAGAQLVNAAFASEKILVIADTDAKIPNQIDKWNESKGYMVLAFNLEEAVKPLGPSDGRNGKELTQTLETGLAHEISHFLDPQKGKLLDDLGRSTNPQIAADEVRAVEMENRVRRDFGMPERTHYGGLSVYGKDIAESKYPGWYKRKDKRGYASPVPPQTLATPLNKKEQSLREYRFEPTGVLRNALKRPIQTTTWLIWR